MGSSPASRRVAADTLLHAAEIVGGVVELARRLQVPIESLSAWTSGDDLPSLEIFMDVLDVIADAPYVNPHTVFNAQTSRRLSRTNCDKTVNSSYD